MQASNYIEIDGTVRANGGTASEIGVGGGAGGSVFLEAQDFLGIENVLRFGKYSDRRKKMAFKGKC